MIRVGKAGTGLSPGRRRALSYIGLAALLLLYGAAVVITPVVARSSGLLMIGRSRLPVSAFAGVLSSLANICIIFLAVFYGKPGFVFALCALLVQVPTWIISSIQQRSLSSVPGLFSTLLAITAIVIIRSRDKRISRYQEDEVRQLREKEQLSQRLFEETATALVTAIDAKDVYSHGHSLRVAEYSRRIAQQMGKSEEECRSIYYAGLLHDVGKLGIPDAIISKKSKLTPEEYDEIKQHPVLGAQILSSISDHPGISIGARYHHEWYDGTGYPEGLKGDEIPEVARIISVADAYDTLSSNRSYRRAVPQQLIREEIVAGAGIQFDPEMAMIMRRLIDQDGEFRMKELESTPEMNGSGELRCGAYRSSVSEGIIVTQEITRIQLTWQPEKPGEGQTVPSILLFDSLDARVHESRQQQETLNYFEYCEIGLDGQTVNHGVRALETASEPAAGRPAEKGGRTVYAIEAVRCRDHVLIRTEDGRVKTTVTIAMPDSSRFAYIALTGESGLIADVRVDKESGRVLDDYIPRIAEEISYIGGPEGDVPNVQVDSIRSAATEGIPVKNGMRLSFHTMSLPTARLIWHCPYVVLFSSRDGRVNGEGYREYAVIRLDGENREDECSAQTRISVKREADFENWESWKKRNKEGFDCTVSFAREGGRVTISTRNLGLAVKSETMLPENRPAGETLYAALTGDQCALTNIRVQ